MHLLRRQKILPLVSSHVANYHGSYKTPKSELGLENKMKTRARAWSYHPVVYKWLRKDVLVKAKFMNQIVSIPVHDKLIDSGVIEDDIEVAYKLSSEDLIELMRKVLLIESQQMFHWKRLEKSCCVHLPSLSISQILYMMDIYFKAGYRAPMFYRNAFQAVELKLYALDIQPKDIVQLLFYASAYRICSVELMRCLEELVAENINAFSGNEIGLICHAFFTTNTSFHNFNLLKVISERTLAELKANNLRPYMVANILKALRHGGYECIKFYQSLCDSIIPYMSNKQYMKTNIELLISFSSVGFSHFEFCHKLVKHISTQLKTENQYLRFKELVKLTSGCLHLGVQCPEVLLDQLLLLMRTKEAAVEYPEMFVDGLVVLIMAGKYPQDLLSYALSPIFLDHKEGRWLEQHFQMLLLDTVAAVKCPGYTAHRLSQDYLSKLPHDVYCNISKELEFRQGLSATLASMQRLTGDTRCVRCHSVNRFSSLPDLEMNLDSKNRPIPLLTKDNLPKVTPKHRTGEVSVVASLTGGQEYAVNRENPGSLHLKPLQDHNKGVRKVIVKVLGWHQFAINSPTLLGLHRYDLHLLQAQGYEVITVSPADAASLEIMTIDEQDRYTRNHLLEKLQCDVT